MGLVPLIRTALPGTTWDIFVHGNALCGGFLRAFSPPADGAGADGCA